MIYNDYPSCAIELEDHEIKMFVENFQRVKHNNVKDPMIAKVEFGRFKEVMW